MEEKPLLIVLRKEIHRVHREFNWYKKLYYNPSDEVKKLLNSTAHNFFIELQNVLSDRCILNISKLTDPYEQNGHYNLSLFFLEIIADKYDWKNLSEIKNSLDEINSITKRVKGKRNKEKVHADLGEVKNPTLLYYISIDEFEEIFNQIGNLMNLYSKKVNDFEWDWYPQAPREIESLLYYLQLGYESESKRNSQ